MNKQNTENLNYEVALGMIREIFENTPDFVGRIEMNCFKGSVSNLLVVESLQVPKIAK